MLIVCPHCAASYNVQPNALGPGGRRVRCSGCRCQWTATSQLPPSSGEETIAPSIQPAETQEEALLAAAAAAKRAASLPQNVRDVGADGGTVAAPTIVHAPESANISTNTAANAVLELEARPVAIAGPRDIESVAAATAGQSPRRQRGRTGFFRGTPMRTPPAAPTLIVLQLAAISAIIGWRSDIVRALPQTASLFQAIGLPVNLRGLTFSDLHTSRDDNAGVTVMVIEGTIENVTEAPVSIPRLRFALRNAAGVELLSWTAPPDQPTLPPGETLPFRSRLASPPPDGYDVSVRFLNRVDFINANGGR